MLAQVLSIITLLPTQEPSCAPAPAGTRTVELRWKSDFGIGPLRRLASSHDWKQFYVNWLKVRYAYNIAKLNAAYGLESTSFTDLTESDFKTLDATREAVKKDDKDFWADFEDYLAAQVRGTCPASVASVAWKRSRT